jgi:hypothetical protein
MGTNLVLPDFAMSCFSISLIFLVDVLSSQFYLMLAPEFLGVLSSFFNFHTDIDDEEEEGNSQLSYTNFATPAQNTSKLPSGPGSSPAVKMASAQQAISKAAPEQIVAPAGTLALNCKIYAIEVILWNGTCLH